MPWIQRTVMPAIFLTHKGVTVYHVYADGDFADGPLAGMFTLYTNDDSAPFCVHALAFPGGMSVAERQAAGASEREAIKQHLVQAIDLGVLVAPPCADEPPMVSEVHVQRSDEEIVQQTNQLAHEFYRLRGYEAPLGFLFYRATHPHEVEAWEAACTAQRALTCTDPEDALDNLGE